MQIDQSFGVIRVRRRWRKAKRPAACVQAAGRFVLATSYSRTTYRCTTIGAAAFHFRVRNGNGWDHCARITRKLARKMRGSFLARESGPVRLFIGDFFRLTVDQLSKNTSCLESAY